MGNLQKSLRVFYVWYTMTDHSGYSKNTVQNDD